MNALHRQRMTAAALAALVLAGCGRTAGAGNAGSLPPGFYPHSQADVDFMSGMIPHHAQAVLIASWAPTHGASESLRILCERIVVAQTDEIALMQQWLADRNLPVPPADAKHHTMVVDGVEHHMLMPGMLTDEELAQLDAARGIEFDRLFLTYMIRHHEGAMQMVDELFASYGAAQEEMVFRLASDIFADQSSEVRRMEEMLAALLPDGGRPEAAVRRTANPPLHTEARP